MAASPKFKIYTSDRRYVASVKELDAAAELLDFYGTGTTLRIGKGPIAWKEATDGFAKFDTAKFEAQVNTADLSARTLDLQTV